MRGKLGDQVEGKLVAKLDANRALELDLQSNLAPTWLQLWFSTCLKLGLKSEAKSGQSWATVKRPIV
jgi:hypothetical protein